MRPAWSVVGTACAVSLTLCFPGCGDVSAQPIGASAGDGGSSEGSTDGPPGDGPAGEGAPPGDSSDFCSGHGPIPLPGTDQCIGDLAHLFRFAACACSSLAVSGALTTDAFASAADGGSAGGAAASVAANGQVATNAKAIVGGSVWAGGQGLVAGTPAVSLTSPAGVTSTIALDVESGGDVLVNGAFLVGHDVAANGNVTLASGSLSVVGGVRVPAGDSVGSGVTAGGGVTNGPVQVAPPCDCANPIDVPSIVAARKTANDDAAIGLSVSGLDAPASPLALPCGQYYVDGIHGGAVELDVTGRAALFVGGDLDVNQGLRIVLAPGTELDLFVAGNVQLQGTTSFGDVNAPARMRLYVGGSAVTLSANATVGANVYAPGADVQLASNFEMWGAFFARSLQFSGYFTIHYDASVLQTPGCLQPGTPCKTCNDCSGATPACKGGACTTCASTADCCAPLECDTGTGRCLLPIE